MPVDRFLIGRLDNFFFTEGFCSLFNASNKNFQKGEGMGEVLKFVTLLARKKLAKNFNFKTFLG